MAEGEVPRTRKTAYLGAGLFALAPMLAILPWHLPELASVLTPLSLGMVAAWSISVALAFAIVDWRNWRAPGRPLVARAVILGLTVVFLAYVVFSVIWWLIEIAIVLTFETSVWPHWNSDPWQILFTGIWGLIFGVQAVVYTLPFGVVAAILFQWLEIRYGGGAGHAKAAE